MKPFDLEAAKAGKPVCTREECPARILAWDGRSISPGGKPRPIVAELDLKGLDTRIVNEPFAQRVTRKTSEPEP